MENSAIAVWDCANRAIRLRQLLSGPRGTVTAITAGTLGGNRVILSVGKDRTLYFWTLRGEAWEKLAVKPKSHARVIWDCCAIFYQSVMSDRGEMVVFGTASRDCSVRIFGVMMSGDVEVGLVAWCNVDAWRD